MPEYREVVVPRDTPLALELRTALASDTTEVEDAVHAVLRQPVIVDGREVLPAGTQVSGFVTLVDRPGRVKGRAHVGYRLTHLRYDGERYTISTEPLEHVGEATKGEDATKIGIGAGAGAALGAVMGGGSGAAKGAAIGGAAGTGVVLTTRGRDVRVEPGTPVTTRLTASVAVRQRVR